jgi:hypothetical protein
LVTLSWSPLASTAGTPFSSRIHALRAALARAAVEAEPHRRIVWIDDDLVEQAADTGEWLAANAHVLVIAPDLFVGLTHEHLDAIEGWL